MQQGNVASLVNGAKVPAGSYDWMRLDLDTSAGKNYVLVCPAGTGTTCASPATITLTIPSGAETGLKIVRGFTMPVNGAIHLMIDFTVDSSIVPIPNSTSWHMKPVLRVVQTDRVGSIAGTISASAMQAAKFSKTACSSTNHACHGTDDHLQHVLDASRRDHGCDDHGQFLERADGLPAVIV